MNRKLQKKNRGFALLFSVLIASLLLTIGLSIFNITLKELSISTATRQSIYSFFAADSGREYALYHDIKLGDLVSFDSEDTQQPEVTLTVTDQPVTGSLDGPYYDFTVTKGWADSQSILTRIEVRGYDNTSDDRVERSIYQTY